MLSIGKVAKATGCKVQTIRYYEKIGLIKDAVRSAGNQRFYQPGDIDRLLFIRHARSLGFSTEVIRELLQLNDAQETSCADVDIIATRQLELIRRQIGQLQNLASELDQMISQCQGNQISQCKIIQSLHKHSHCDEHQPLTLASELSDKH